MRGYFVLTLLVLVFDGVFGDEVTVTVKEGDPVTLNSNVTKQQDEIMRWYFNGIHIAHINGHPNTSCLYDGEGGIFRDRLEVNYETGSLTIPNIRSEHTGHYKLEYNRRDGTATNERMNRTSTCDRTRINRKPNSDDRIIKSFRLIFTVSVMEGNSVILNSDVPKQQDEIMRWYFNGIHIAHINGHPNTSCLYDGEGGIFRDRLEVNYETGSLTIPNIRSEHTGHYELEYNRRDGTATNERMNRTSTCNRTRINRKPNSDDDRIIKSFRLIVSAVPDSTPSAGAVDSGPSSAAVIGIVVGVLLVCVAVASVVGVILYRRRTDRNAVVNNSQDPLMNAEV